MRDVYTHVSGGKFMDKPSIHKIKQDLVTLVKSNYLGEFKTTLEKNKVKRNLGIVDNDTVTWEAISGNPESNTELNNILLNLPFDSAILEDLANLDEVETIQDIIVYLNDLVKQTRELLVITLGSIMNLPIELQSFINSQTNELSNRISAIEANILRLESIIGDPVTTGILSLLTSINNRLNALENQ